MLIPLGDNDWESAAEDVSRLKVHNMYLAESPQSPDGIMRIGRPALSFVTAIGAGYQIDGFYRQDGLLNGDVVAIQSDLLWQIDFESQTLTPFADPIPGSGICEFAGTDTRLMFLRDTVAYSYDGSTLTAVTMPNNEAIQSLASINGYILYAEHGTDTFYWATPGNINPDALGFATAERFPDSLVKIAIVADEIWLLGSTGVEVWQATGNADAPFARLPARVYDEGCETRNAAVVVTMNSLPGLVWVTDKRTVVAAQGATKKISTPSVDELLKTSTNFRAWTFRHNRNDFYVLTSDDFTLVYDITMNKWYRWDSYLKNRFSAHLGLMIGSQVYGADYENGNIFELVTGSEDEYTSYALPLSGDTTLPIVREISGMVMNPGKPTACNEVILKVNSGQIASYTDDDTIELRWSDDQGFTWSDYRQADLGNLGSYDTEVQFRSLGLIKRPGRIFEIRYTGDRNLRLDYATMNEA